MIRYQRYITIEDSKKSEWNRSPFKDIFKKKKKKKKKQLMLAVIFSKVQNSQNPERP